METGMLTDLVTMSADTINNIWAQNKQTNNIDSSDGWIQYNVFDLHGAAELGRFTPTQNTEEYFSTA